MYRSATSTRLSRGRSTPAIRATAPLASLTLPLLVARVRADHHDPPVPADHLALLAHLLDRRSDPHRQSRSLVVGAATGTGRRSVPARGRTATAPPARDPLAGSGCSSSASCPRCGSR